MQKIMVRGKDVREETATKVEFGMCSLVAVVYQPLVDCKSFQAYLGTF